MFRLRGYGVKSLQGGQGDQLVKIFVRTPTDLSEKSKELLKQLAAEDGDVDSKLGEGGKSFFDKVKQALGGH